MDSTSNNGASSSNSSVAAKFWDNIWKANIPPKIKVCVWRICKNLLPTRSNLFETILHLLKECPFARYAWLSSPMGIPLRDFNRQSPMLWVMEIVDQIPPCHFDSFLVICWAIWGARNSMLWDGRCDSPDTLWLMGFNGGNLSSNQMPLCHLLQRGLLKSTNGFPNQLVL